MALPSDLGRACPAIVARDAWHSCHYGYVFFVLLASSFLCFVVDPTFVAADLGHEFARSA